jgi:hypothetical protein
MTDKPEIRSGHTPVDPFTLLGQAAKGVLQKLKVAMEEQEGEYSNVKGEDK